MRARRPTRTPGACIIREAVWIQTGPGGDVAVVYLEADDLAAAFTQAMLTDLARRLAPLRRATGPFATPVPAPHAAGARWVHPGWSAR